MRKSAFDVTFKGHFKAQVAVVSYYDNCIHFHDVFVKTCVHLCTMTKLTHKLCASL